MLDVLQAESTDEAYTAECDGHVERPVVADRKRFQRRFDNNVLDNLSLVHVRGRSNVVPELAVHCLSGEGQERSDGGDIVCDRRLEKRSTTDPSEVLQQLGVEDVVVCGEGDSATDVSNSQGDSSDRSNKLWRADGLGDDRSWDDDSTRSEGCEGDDSVDSAQVVCPCQRHEARAHGHESGADDHEDGSASFQDRNENERDEGTEDDAETDGERADSDLNRIITCSEPSQPLATYRKKGKLDLPN